VLEFEPALGQRVGEPQAGVRLLPERGAGRVREWSTALTLALGGGKKTQEIIQPPPAEEEDRPRKKKDEEQTTSGE
jgi:hypothetical protein